MNNKDHNADISKTDTIYRQSAIDTLADMHCKSDEDGYVWIIRSDAWARIDALPSAQPKRKAGHWEFQGDRMFMCTCCCYLASQEQLESWRVKKTDSAFPLFCPNCGARMEEPEDIPMEYFEGGGR